MRIAALYDVHGNMPALEAVLADVDDERVDAIVCGGDLVLGAQPAECLALMRERGARYVRGNCERLVLDRDDETSAWCDDRLDDDARAFLAALPTTVSLDGVCFCHGSPRADDEILTAATPDDVVAEMLADVPQTTVVCGHTHHQFDRVSHGARIVNAGSIGMPYEGRPGARWAMIGPDVELRSTAYDLDAAATAIRATGFPDADELVATLREPPTADEVARHFESLASR